MASPGEPVSEGSFYHVLLADGRGWILGTVSLGWMWILGMRLVFPALLPQIKDYYVLDNAIAGAVITAIWLGYALVHFPAGLLVDRTGERAVMTVSLLLGAVAILSIVVFDSFLAFFGAAVLFGLGTGLYATPRSTVLSNVFADRDGTAFGISFAAGNLGAALIPFLAGAIAVQLGWKFGFGFAVPIFILAAVALWAVLPKETVTGRGRGGTVRDYASSIFVVTSRPETLLTAGGITLMTFTYQGFTSFYPTYLVEIKGLDPGIAATVFGLLFFCGAIFQGVAGSVADRIGAARTLTLIALLGAVSLGALPWIDGTLSLLGYSGFLAVRFAVGPINNALLIDLIPAEIQGSVYGLIRTGYLILGATGAFVVGSMVDVSSFDVAFLVLAGITGFAGVLYVWLMRMQPT